MFEGDRFSPCFFSGFHWTPPPTHVKSAGQTVHKAHGLGEMEWVAAVVGLRGEATNE